MAELRDDASAGRDARAADAGPDRRSPQLHERGPDGVPASEPRIAGEHGVRSQGHCGASRHDADPGRDPAHRAVPTRLPLAQVNPGQQVLDIQTKLLTHAIRMAAFNTMTALARAVRVYTGYARAADEAHNLIRQALTGSGDINPSDGVLTVRLDPLSTRRVTTAIAELCEHLTATETRYPGTDLVLRYEVKNRP